MLMQKEDPYDRRKCRLSAGVQIGGSVQREEHSGGGGREILCGVYVCVQMMVMITLVSDIWCLKCNYLVAPFCL